MESEKAKKTSEDEIDEYEFGEEMEDYVEDSLSSRMAIGSCLPPTIESTEESESEGCTESEESYNTKKERMLKMKWLTVTGRRPLSLPIAMTYEPKKEDKDEVETVTRFGERRPLFVEQRRKENWLRLKMKRELARSYGNLGRVLKEIRLMEYFWGLRCLRFSPTGETLATSFGDGTVQIRNSDTGEVSLTLQTIDNLYRLGIPAVRYHPLISNRIYVGGGVGIIQVFDTENPKYIASIREKNNEITNLDVSPDGTLLVSVGKDGNIYIYDAIRLRLLSMQKRPALQDLTTPDIEFSYHYMRIFGLKYHPTDTNLFVTGGWDNTVKVWDTRVCGAVNSIYGPRICGDSIDVRGNEILTGSWMATNSLKLWDLSSGKVLRHVSIRNRSSPIDGDFIYVAKFFTGMQGVDSIIIGGNGTDEVEIVDIENEMALANFPALKAVTALDSYGQLVAYGGMESVLRFGDLKNPKSIHHQAGKRLEEERFDFGEDVGLVRCAACRPWGTVEPAPNHPYYRPFTICC